MAKTVSKEEFDNLTKEDKILLVDLAATWCGPCQMMAPIFEELSKEYEKNDKINIVSVDIDESPEIPARFSVMSVPTFLFVKDGKVIDTIIGAVAKDILKSKIDELLK